jgi:nucleotide-binding universal stress UspA family protein
MHPPRVLLALDGRLASEAALPVAVDLARDSGGDLYALRVVEALPPTVGDSIRHQAAVQRAEHYLAAIRARLADEGVEAVSTAVWCGSPAAAIVKAADLIEADVIVMARSGRTGAPRALVGSVVERVLRGTKRPVLVIAPAEATVDAPPGDAAPLATGVAPAAPAVDAPAPADAEDPPPRDAYAGALRELEACERDVLRLVALIRDAATHLDRWPAVHVAHAGAGFPKEVTMTGPSIDAAQWPTGGQLADALAAWHAAVEEARTAWTHLPAAERADLSPPP